MERSRTSSRLTCKPDRAPDRATSDASLAAGSRAAGTGDLFAIGVLLVIANDPPQSYPAAVTALLKDTWPSFDRGPCSVNRPGHPGPAEKSCVRPLPARASRLVGLCAPFRLPAYVGFRLYRRWPIRQPCPNCHAQAPRDRVACAECGTRFPDPSLKGIEIFA